MKSSRTKWWVLGTVCFALFMVNLDGNVVSLAMPTIVRDFHATLAQLEWISNAYMLTFAVFLITLGRLGDEIGRKRLFLAGLLVFAVGSALCGAAASIGQLIVFRIIQGIGGSAMMPATLSLITANFEKEERGRAMGFWGAVSGLAFIAGPIIGGYLTQSGIGPSVNAFLGIDQYWRYVFYVNVPFGIVALVVGLFVIPESRDSESSRRLDLLGVTFSSIAVFLLTYGFIEGPRLGWWAVKTPLAIAGAEVSPFGLSVVPLLFAAALMFGILFFARERARRGEPLVDLALFRNANYSLGMAAGVILNFALMGATFLLPLFFQSVLGISPLQSGTVLLPFALAILITSPLAGILSDRIDGKWILVAGMTVLVVSDLVMGHFRVDTRPVETIVPFVIMGIGMGLSMTPLTNLTLYGVPSGKTGGASGVLSTTRQIGAVMGIAVFSVVLQTTLVTNVATHIREVPQLPAPAQTMVVKYIADGGMYGTGDSGPQALQGMLVKSAGAAPASQFSPETLARLASGVEHAMKSGFTDSINQTFLVAALFGVLGIGVSLLVRPKGKTLPRAQMGELASAPREVQGVEVL